MTPLVQAGLIVTGTLVVLFLVYMFFSKETYMDVVKEIERENDPAKHKYEAQAITTSDPDEQKKQYEAIATKATKMAMEQAEDPEDLLPYDDEADAWARTVPETSGTVHDQNFLEAGYHVGIDTQGSSMKIPNYDIRSMPPIPMEPVGIWNQSSYTPNPYRKKLEIGE